MTSNNIPFDTCLERWSNVECGDTFVNIIYEISHVDITTNINFLVFISQINLLVCLVFSFRNLFYIEGLYILTSGQLTDIFVVPHDVHKAITHTANIQRGSFAIFCNVRFNLTALDTFAKVVKVINHTGLRNAELECYLPDFLLWLGT